MKKSFVLNSLLFASAFLFSFIDAPLPTGNFVVIVNKENPVSTLNAGEAKLYFMRKLKTRWPGINKNIRPVTRKTKCAERDSFYNVVLKMSDSEVDSYFAERQFQNAEKLPELFNSDSEVIAFVEQEVGGIGFVSAKSLTAGSNEKIKIVFEF